MERNNDLSLLWQQTFSTLFAATNKLQVKGDSALGTLTMRQLMLLIGLLHLPEEDTTIVNISKTMGASKQSTTQIVDILKRKGFLGSAKSPKDGRAVNLFLTEEGASILEAEFEAGMTMFEQFFKEFTEEELQQFLGYLQRLQAYDEDKTASKPSPLLESITQKVIPDQPTQEQENEPSIPAIPVETLTQAAPPAIQLRENAIAAINKFARGKQGLILTIGLAQGNNKEHKIYGEDAREIPADATNAVYELGTITNVFTTSLLAKYVSEGRAALADSIDKYLTLPTGRYPTLQQLATHTAGYPQLLPLSLGKYAGRILKYDSASANPYDKNTSHEELLTLAATKSAGGLDAPYVYSNFGIGVLGAVLAQIAGRSWWEEMSDFVQNELGLSHTRPGVQPGLLPGYRGRKQQNNWQWTPEHYMAPSGALSSTPEDLLQFGCLQMSGTKPYLTMAHQKYASKYGEFDVGLAWELREDERAICHEGTTGCFSSYLVFNKEKQAVVSIQSNHPFNNISRLGRQILEEM